MIRTIFFIIFNILLSSFISCAEHNGLDSAIAEIRAIANARIRYNESWKCFLQNGCFEVSTEGETANKIERLKKWDETFSKNERLSKQEAALGERKFTLLCINNPRAIDEVLNTFIKQCENDIKIMSYINQYLDVLHGREHFVDGLFSYLHYRALMRKELTADEDSSEKFWLQVMKNKLEPFLQVPGKKFKKSIFLQKGGKKFEVKIITDSSRQEEITSAVQEVLNLFGKKLELNRDHTQECLNEIYDKIEKHKEYKSKILARREAIYQESLVTLSKLTEKDFIEKSAYPIVFYGFCVRELFPMFYAVEDFSNRESEEEIQIKQFVEWLNNFPFGKCCKTQAVVELTAHETLPEEAYDTPEHAQLEEDSDSEKEEDSDSEVEELIKFHTMAEDVAAATSAQTLTDDALIPASVEMIFSTRGEVDYNAFIRQIGRDFPNKAFVSTGTKTTTIKIMTENKIAYAFFHKPHGTQAIKSWPQWRHQVKGMFQELGFCS